VARLRYIDIVSILAYLITVIILLLPEFSKFLSQLETSQRILLLIAMVIVPALPFLIARAEMIYSLFCKLFKVSEDEKKLLSMIWSNPFREWTEEDLCKVTQLEVKRVQNLVKRLKRRGLIETSEIYSKEKEK